MTCAEISPNDIDGTQAWLNAPAWLAAMIRESRAGRNLVRFAANTIHGNVREIGMRDTLLEPYIDGTPTLIQYLSPNECTTSVAVLYNPVPTIRALGPDIWNLIDFDKIHPPECTRYGEAFCKTYYGPPDNYPIFHGGCGGTETALEQIAANKVDISYPVVKGKSCVPLVNGDNRTRY